MLTLFRNCFQRGFYYSLEYTTFLFPRTPSPPPQSSSLYVSASILKHDLYEIDKKSALRGISVHSAYCTLYSIGVREVRVICYTS